MDNSSYRQIFKATSLFGGVQVFIILIQIVRSKFIAVLLGPAGMGIAGLFNSTNSLVSALTNFGLERSAVRDVAANSNDTNELSTTISVLRKLIWFTGTLGLLITLIFSTTISQLTFGSSEYSTSFKWLSGVLFFNQLAIGYNVLLRGLRQLKYMALSNLIGSFAGLIISIPLYYFFSTKGIVPAIIISSLTTLLIASYFSRKIDIKTKKISIRETIIKGKPMLKMGFVLSLSTLIVIGSSYIVRIVIRNLGSIEDVGFYNAGFAIVNSYFGVFFTALTTDYYPRLAALSYDNKKANILVNQQSEMSVLVLSPVLTIFLIYINFIVILLYSNEFIPIREMILWAALGIYFKSASWSLGVSFIAHGDAKTLFWSELVANSISLLLNILGYYTYGLSGLGVSFMMGFIYSFLQTFFLVKLKYSFTFSKSFVRIFLIQLFFGLSCFLIILFLTKPLSYLLGSLFILLAIVVSFKELDKRLNIQAIIMDKKKQFFNK